MAESSAPEAAGSVEAAHTIAGVADADAPTPDGVQEHVHAALLEHQSAVNELVAAMDDEQLRVRVRLIGHL